MRAAWLEGQAEVVVQSGRGLQHRHPQLRIRLPHGNALVATHLLGAHHTLVRPQDHVLVQAAADPVLLVLGRQLPAILMYMSAIFLCSAWIDKFNLRHPLLHVDGGYPTSSIARFTDSPLASPSFALRANSGVVTALYDCRGFVSCRLPAIFFATLSCNVGHCWSP